MMKLPRTVYSVDDTMYHLVDQAHCVVGSIELELKTNEGINLDAWST